MPGVSVTPGPVMVYSNIARLICPLLAGQRLPVQRSPVLSHSWVVTMSFGSIGLCLKAFLFPAMQSEPKFLLEVELEIGAIADQTTASVAYA